MNLSRAEQRLLANSRRRGFLRPDSVGVVGSVFLGVTGLGWEIAAIVLLVVGNGAAARNAFLLGGFFVMIAATTRSAQVSMSLIRKLDPGDGVGERSA